MKTEISMLKNTGAVLEWTVPAGCRDSVSGPMLTNNTMPGLMRAQTVDSGKTLLFDTDGFCSIESPVEQGAKGSLVCACLAVCDALASAGEYMLDVNALVFDAAYLYSTADYKEGRMLCLPGSDGGNGIKTGAKAGAFLAKLAQSFLLSGRTLRSEAGLARFIVEKEEWQECDFTVLRRFADLCRSLSEGKNAALIDLRDGRTYEISAKGVTAGRDSSVCGLHLCGEGHVSRRHARFEKKNDAFYLSDLNSSNGSFVNSERLCHGEERRLACGDIIRLADCSFGFFC